MGVDEPGKEGQSLAINGSGSGASVEGHVLMVAHRHNGLSPDSHGLRVGGLGFQSEYVGIKQQEVRGGGVRRLFWGQIVLVGHDNLGVARHRWGG